MSRVTGLHVIDTLPVSLDGCPDTWNVTTRAPGTDTDPDTWWLHVSVDEVSYMWYSGLACCIVVVLGSVLSLVPGLQQEDYPEQDLLVPVMEVSILHHSQQFRRLKNCFQVLFCCWPSSVQNSLEKYFKRRRNVVPGEELGSEMLSKVQKLNESTEGVP